MSSKQDKHRKKLSDDKPQKNLTKGISKTGGRNNRGRITMRHRGGGHKRLYRNIDFKRNKMDIEARVEDIEYDPNRSAFIARVVYEDGEKSYVLAPAEVERGDTMISADEVEIETGNRTYLRNIPTGTEVYNVELQPGKGGQMARSAGTSLKVLANEEGYTHLKMASGEIRKVSWDCLASIGQVSNPQHDTLDDTKAGDSRHKGRRPKVRGSAMNAVDHQRGGGEGRQPQGAKYPKDKWGNIQGGRKTRKKNKKSDNMIVKRRQETKRKKGK